MYLTFEEVGSSRGRGTGSKGNQVGDVKIEDGEESKKQFYEDATLTEDERKH